MVEEAVSKYVSDRYENFHGKLVETRKILDGFTRPDPEHPERYNEYLDRLSKIRQVLQSIQLPYSQEEARIAVQQMLDRDAPPERTVDDIAVKYEQMIAERKEELVRQARDANAHEAAKLEESNRVYLQLEEKRKALEGYSDRIMDACRLYGITSADVTVANDTFTVGELDKLYDQYIDYMEKPRNAGNIIRSFRQRVPNVFVQGCIFLGVLLLAFTPVFDFFMIAGIMYLGYIQSKAAGRVQVYTLLLGLLYNVQPLAMGFRETVDPGCLVSEEVDDEDVRLKGLLDAYEKEVTRLEGDVSAYEEKCNRAMQEFVSSLPKFMELFKKKQGDFEEAKRNILKLINEQIEIYSGQFDELKQNFKLLGAEISNSAVFNTKFRLGLRDCVIEQVVDIGLSNIIIKPCNDLERQQHFLIVLLANAMSNVKAGNLAVYVYDPNGMGRSVVELFDKGYEDLFIFESGKLDKLVEQLSKYAESNISELKSMDINTYNQEAERLGKAEKDYKLLLVLSQPKTIEEDEALSHFMTYSARMGVFVWMISNKHMENTYCFTEPFMGVANPYPIDVRIFGKSFVKNFIEARKKNRPTALLWENFRDILCPDSEMWTSSGDEFIDIDPGLENGDPDKSAGYTVGHKEDVHALAVGQTGGGKSVFLNNLIANMCQKYPPTDLELWLIDYKCMEFGFYIPKPGQEYTFPHIKTCLCTTDGDYAESVYAALSKEVEDRSRLFKTVGLKNLKEYNQLMVRLNTPEKRLPRIVFINDEFQVIFEKAKGKILDSIEKNLTNVAKLGRALGVHLLFTSQSMKGTVKADVLQQFTLRFALKCAEEVSMDILGTKKASEMKEAYGFVIASSQRDKSRDAQKKYKVPLLENEVLLSHMKKTWDEAKKRKMPMHDLIQYDEETVHGIDELQKFYIKLNENSETTPETGLIVLGNRMTYSTENRAPENVIMTQERGSSIFSVFSETVDIVDFYKEIILNLEMFRNKPQIFVNSQVKAYYYVCEVEKVMTGVMESFGGVDKDVFELVDMFDKMLKSRVAHGTEGLTPAYYVLIGWDAAEGFGVERNHDIIDRITNRIKRGGEYGMHFIFICSSMADISKSVSDACNYKIAGVCDEKASYALLDTSQGSQPSDKKNGFLYLKMGNALPVRAKLYISPKTREIEKKTFVM